LILDHVFWPVLPRFDENFVDKDGLGLLSLLALASLQLSDSALH
jgi:hypothetical protein